LIGARKHFVHQLSDQQQHFITNRDVAVVDGLEFVDVRENRSRLGSASPQFRVGFAPQTLPQFLESGLECSCDSNIAGQGVSVHT